MNHIVINLPFYPHLLLPLSFNSHNLTMSTQRNGLHINDTLLGSKPSSEACGFPGHFSMQLFFFFLFLSASNESITVLVTGDACHNRSIFDVLTTVYMYITVFGLRRRAVWYTGTFRPTPTIHISLSNHLLLRAGYTTPAHSNSFTPSELRR